MVNQQPIDDIEKVIDGYYGCKIKSFACLISYSVTYYIRWKTSSGFTGIPQKTKSQSNQAQNQVFLK